MTTKVHRDEDPMNVAQVHGLPTEGGFILVRHYPEREVKGRFDTYGEAEAYAVAWAERVRLDDWRRVFTIESETAADDGEAGFDPEEPPVSRPFIP